MPTDDTESEVVEEYEHDCRIVSEANDSGELVYHYEGPLGRIQSFRSLDKAKLYADVHTVTGGFREEKTGERGIPPSVARAREDVLMAYLASQPTMGFDWVNRFYSDVNEDTVRGYIRNVQNRAEEQRDES